MKKLDTIDFLQVEGPVLLAKHWASSNPKAISVTLDREKNSVIFNLSNEKPHYILCGGNTSDFDQLTEASGIKINTGTSFSILTVAILTGEVKAMVRLLEFDESRKRINTQDFKINTFGTFVPHANTHYIIFSIRIVGTGTLELKKLRCIPIKTATLLGRAPEMVIEAPAPTALPQTIPRRPAPGPMLSESLRLRALLESVANEVGRTVATLEGSTHTNGDLYWPMAELQKLTETISEEKSKNYMWQRRAIGWEEKFNSADDGNRRKTAFSHATLIAMALSMPSSNGCRYFKKFPYKLAIVTDVYMYNFYKDAFETVVYLTPENYHEAIAETDFDLFIYVTSWKGINGEEWKGIKYRGAVMTAFNSILNHCKEKNIPTVFQSIEDPSNFENFLPIASMFGTIVTSDVDMIDRYKVECGHDQVFYGEYGANPLLNNPIGSMRTALNAAFFAGSYPERYEERCKDMHTIFDSIQENGGTLIIADRNHGSNDFQFPQAYRSAILPPLEHELLQKVHKLFRYSLNFNSIKASPTMCAMRIYELQAQGRALLSNYAKSVFNKFPEIRIIPHKENIALYFEKPESYEDQRANMDCLRNIMTGRTSFDVVATLLRNVGLTLKPDSNTSILVILDQESNACRKDFDAQSYIDKYALIRSDVPTGAAWDRFVADNRIGYITVFNQNSEYEPHYLQDMVNGFKYTSCDYITKEAFFDENKLKPGKSHEYTNVVSANWRTVFAAETFNAEAILALDTPTVIENGYSIDPFQLNYRRYCAAQKSEAPESPRLSVIVPVYNNGVFLQSKCIPSLQRNALWQQMEVLLIDDGSTDLKTVTICHDLVAQYSNIKLFSFNDGGSGSASRPRNKGCELATAALITFLDPDNEISSGGYDRLVELFEAAHAEDKNLGFVSGYQVKVNETSKSIGAHTTNSFSKIDDLKAHFFGRNKFPIISTQAAVIHSSLIKSGKLKFIEKAAGQDTLYGWELAAYAGVGAFTADVHLIYYAERNGSVTNQIGIDYFTKKIIMEKAQIKALRKHGILDAYIAHHLDFFIHEWYMKKLALVPEKQQYKCKNLLVQIIKMYGADPSKYGLI